MDCGGIALSRRATGIAVTGVDTAAENQIIVATGASLDTCADQVRDFDLAPGITVLCQNELRPEATSALLGRAKAQSRTGRS